MNNVNITIFFILVFSLVATSTWSKTNAFYKATHLGEHDIGLYYGPLYPDFDYRGYRKNYVLKDETYKDQFLTKSIQDQIITVDQFFLEELPSSWVCSNNFLKDHIVYIRFLYRVLAMSYLFEGVENFKQVLKQNGQPLKFCSVNWKKHMTQCRPKSKDMKRFIDRANFLFSQYFRWEKGRIGKFTESEQKSWVEKLFSNDMEMNNIIKSRLNATSSLPLDKDIKEVSKAMVQSCQADLNEFTKICSELDDYYGYSDIPFFSFVLGESDAIRFIDLQKSKDCLDRFTDLFKGREIIPSYFPEYFKAIYYHNRGNKRGSLFVAGSLKEFDEKGLDDFFQEKPAPTPTPKVVVAYVVPTPTPTPKPKEVKVTKIIPTPMPKVVKKSEFESKRSLAMKQGKKFALVKMTEMVNEFLIDADKVSKLDHSLAVFKTRKALSDLKEYDDFGSQGVPVSLLFIQYLIQKKYQQGLYNVKSVLGHQFWVVNDIEGYKQPVLIELDETSANEFLWQIKILNPRNI